MVVADALSRRHLSQNDYDKASKIVIDMCLEYVDVDPRDCDYTSF